MFYFALNDVPRQPRLNLPGLYYHVMVRGIERRTIFRTPADRWDFLRRLGEGIGRSGCHCFAWALMTNHLHLLILSGLRGLVSLMHPLLTGYAVTFNLKYRRVGHLFQNRYKAIICEEDPYFLELVRYIALQPVRAGLVRTPQELAAYPWTSHRALMGGPALPWLEAQAVLSRFGNNLPASRTLYLQFVKDGWNQGPRRDLEGGGLLRSAGGAAEALALRRSNTRQMADVRILGSGSFVEDILRQAEALDQKKGQVMNQWSREELQEAIGEFSIVDPRHLTSRHRARPAAGARAMLVYAAREWLGLNGAGVGRWLGMSSGSVSKAYARGRALAENGGLFQFLQRKKGSYVP